MTGSEDGQEKSITVVRSPTIMDTTPHGRRSRGGQRGNYQQCRHHPEGGSSCTRARRVTTGGSPMAYVAIPLFLSLGGWLLLAVKSGPTRRFDPVAAAEPVTVVVRTEAVASAHTEMRTFPAGRHHLTDDRSSRDLADDQQPARGLRVGQQDQVQFPGGRRRYVRSHPVEVAA